MEDIKEFEGEKYIRYDQDRTIKKRTMMNAIFLILLSLAIIGLFITIKVMLDNKELLQAQPVYYVLKKNNFLSCQCIDDNDNLYTANRNQLEDEGIV